MQQANLSEKVDGQNVQLYSAGLKDYIFLSGLIFFFLGLGIFLLCDKQSYSSYSLYLIAWAPIVIAGMPVLKIFRTIKSLSISDDSIVVSYPLHACVYPALEIETIDWVITLVWKGNLPHHSYTSLLIRLVNGRKIKIPGSPYSSFDMRKTLLDWCHTYNPTVLENISREGINSL